ncbi:hypothetical protein DENIS_3992 [Desulfonema ishimotonii]|uniref:Solute-binding protein family 3/N-terminal domain-containing protein n=1 Tax=Desulfonema ishimotonii TaxID=45657 RepID=A0A401G1D9_9BACT|nr:transporter substrate-binding domain-containing protein [Desulfonema ishimotonii]GBC63003.1 hypothetical protein DENIS_3992 [Desulfonema ishimotonii]
MKHIKVISFFIIMLVLATDAVAEKDGLTIVCDEWPPYQVVEQNNISGFSTRVVKAVFKKMDVSINSIKAYPWKRAITMLEKGKADALFSASFSEARTAFAYYPEEMLVESPWVLWVREEDDLKFDTYDDLIPKKIGVVSGYSYTREFDDFLKKHGNYEEVFMDDLNFKKLNAGRIDYAVAELGNGSYLISKLGLGEIIPLKENPIKSNGLYIIFNKNNIPESFVKQFSEALKKFKNDSLYRYWHDEYLRFDRGQQSAP